MAETLVELEDFADTTIEIPDDSPAPRSRPTGQSQFLTLSDHQYSQLTAQVRKHRDEALVARADFPVRHADRYRRYQADPSLRPLGPWPEAARLFTPATRDVLERLHAEAWLAMFGNILQISLQPFGDEDIEQSEKISRFFRWGLTKTMDFTGVTMTLLFDALLDSVGVAKVMAYEPPWEPPSEEAKRFLSRTVRIDALDLGMLLVAPDAEGLQYPEARYVAQEFFLTSDDLLRMEKRGFDVPYHDQLGASQRMTERKRVEMEREGQRVVEFHPDSIPFVESYERFVIDDDDGRGLETDIIVSWFPDAMISGESHDTEDKHGRIAGVRKLTDVFPQDDRPRRPFFPVTFWPQPRQWRGLNVPDRLESMQDVINRLHEQMINYGEVSMLPYFFVNTFLTGEVPDLHTIRPGSGVTVDDSNGIEFAPTRSLNRHFAEVIGMQQADIERDSQVIDNSNQRTQNRGRQTATATRAVAMEARKSYSMLIRQATAQVEQMYNFTFRLWQEILPEGAMAQIFEPKGGSTDSGEPENVFDRLFAGQPLSEAGRPRGQRLVAGKIAKENISGLYDVTVEVNPEAQFDRQVQLSLYEITAPSLTAYPMGNRLALKRIWTAHGQDGFDDIYPEEIANLQSQQIFMTMQIQLEVAKGQLAQIQQEAAQGQQQKAQGQLANFEALLDQASETGEIPPELAQLAQEMAAGQNGEAATNGNEGAA